MTHSHPDHIGNLDRIWWRWIRVYAHMHSFQKVNSLMDLQSTVYNPLLMHLVEPTKYDELTQSRDASKFKVSSSLLSLRNQHDILYLTDGDVYHNGEYRFEVITTPGHDDWYICYEPRKKLLISGDHIL